MSSIKIDKTIKPGDLVRVEAWINKALRRNDPESAPGRDSVAVVLKIEEAAIFGGEDALVHLLFSGESSQSVAMLSRLTKLNPN